MNQTDCGYFPVLLSDGHLGKGQFDDACQNLKGTVIGGYEDVFWGPVMFCFLTDGGGYTVTYFITVESIPLSILQNFKTIAKYTYSKIIHFK